MDHLPKRGEIIFATEIRPPTSDFDLETALMQAPKRVCGRYAPSPTGPLHIGNIQTALLSWLHARLRNGIFLLRMEDLDTPRMREGAAQQIIEDLRWLGLEWDEGPDVGGEHGPYTQSERLHIYAAALSWLFYKGLVFPCLCSRKDLIEAASAPHGPSGSVYPGTCRKLNDDQLLKLQKHKNQKPFAWRIKVPASTLVEFADQLQGFQRQVLDREVGDFILKRADRLFAYQLAVVIDDALMGVSDVVRAVDLLDSAARQIYLFECFGEEPANFCHVPLLMDPATGKRLSKRDGSDSLAQLRDAGMRPQDIIGQIANMLGLIDKPSPISALELKSELDMASFEAALMHKSKLDYQN